MKRRILFGLFVCITGMFAVVPFAYAGGSTSFTDPAGDANGAPDIQRIDVSNDDGGTVNFRIQVDAVQKPSDTRVYIFLDTDRNVSTGSATLDGVDYILSADESDNSFDIGRWDGANWVDTPYATVAVNSDSTGWNFSVNKSELGGTDGFDFWVRTRLGDVSLDKADTAPENGTFRYMFGSSATSPPSTTPPATTPAASTPKPKLVVADASLLPHAGASFSFRIDHVVLWAVTYHIATATTTVDRVTTFPQKIACNAVLAGRPLSGTGLGRCTWKLPKTARGKQLRVKVTVSGALLDDPITQTFTLGVR